MLTVQKKAARISYSDCRARKHRSHHGCWRPRLGLSILNTFRAWSIVLVRSPRVRSAIQVSVAVTALLVALVVGPNIHVHQGEGPNRETVVHIHFGIVGHVHGGSPLAPGLSFSGASGAAAYFNAYSSIETHALAVPTLIPQPMRLSAPAFSAEGTFSEPAVNAHAPPLIDFACPRPPPLAFSA